MSGATVLIVPGLRDHVAEHWQTLLGARLPKVRAVPPMGRADLDCAARVEAIERAAQAVEGPLILCAHSGGTVMAAHWARVTKRPVLGALLATPPDFERPMPEGFPTVAQLEAGGWLPVPRGRLPFPSVVAASRNDPLADYGRIAELARAWGSRLVDLGEVGHLNPASGYGDWPMAESLIAELETGRRRSPDRPAPEGRNHDVLRHTHPRDRRAGSAHAGAGRGRRARAGRGAGPPHLRRRQLHRRLFPHRALPDAAAGGLGSDAVGVVEAVGPGVTDIRPGDRVGYLLGPQGAYSDVRVMPADVLIPIPDGVKDSTASTIMMKGMTAQYLFRQVYPLQGGETILYHAAAGGVGLIACQLARALGVTMIGTVSTDEKAEIAKANGCAHVIVTSREDIAKRVREITDGKGVPVVYDSVGKDTLMASLDSLQPRGSLVSNGTSSGPVVVDSTLLAVKGSLWMTRPAMVHYATPRSRMLDMAREVFGWVLDGKITSEPNQTYALSEAAEAHRALESRRTVGATVLMP